MAIQQSSSGSSLQHQMMGYDRSSTMFSPDGRLLQVEYAKKSVKQGTASIGLVCKDGVVILADKRVVEKLIIPSSIEKVFKVDEHIAATATGFLMDGRVLIERAQTIAQQHRVTYDSPIDTFNSNYSFDSSFCLKCLRRIIFASKTNYSSAVSKE